MRYENNDQFSVVTDPVVKYLTKEQKQDLVNQIKKEMLEAAENLQFEKAASLRDSLAQLEAQLKGK